jgi:proprotein convertase subtilisin/kexin type 5
MDPNAGNNCVDSCNSSYYNDNGTCKPCDSNCLTCSSVSTYCTSCNSDLIL